VDSGAICRSIPYSF